jgi:hypothetical protein
MKPKHKPIAGAKTIKIKVLYQPAATITPNPLFAMAAPAYPPISAWEELLGRPKYQVVRFHKMAPPSPARITVGVTVLISTIPFPIVWATVVLNMRKATKLKNAAQMTARRGDKTLVETIVEIEFAASCIPFVKSKTKAMNTIKMMNNRLI